MFLFLLLITIMYVLVYVLRLRQWLDTTQIVTSPPPTQSLAGTAVNRYHNGEQQHHHHQSYERYQEGEQRDLGTFFPFFLLLIIISVSLLVQEPPQPVTITNEVRGITGTMMAIIHHLDDELYR